MLRKKWEAYANISQKDAYSILVNVLEEQKKAYKVLQRPPIFMYDSKNDQVLFKTKQFEISLIYVSADPVTRLFTSLLRTERNFTGITLFSIIYDKDSKKNVASILQKFNSNCTEKPWNILVYPRFRFALLLQFITKWKWKKLLSV